MKKITNPDTECKVEFCNNPNMQTCGFCSVYLSTSKSRQHQLITKFVCQQCHITQDAIPEVFLSMVKLVFDYVIYVTADVLLSGHLC
nr:hypothetical protein BgiMline_029673 [Biomphalaria glabrata]